ncbi:hypothetical protein ABPG72_009320 [Tetrahymena utriculariae]
MEDCKIFKLYYLVKRFSVLREKTSSSKKSKNINFLQNIKVSNTIKSLNIIKNNFSKFKLMLIQKFLTSSRQLTVPAADEVTRKYGIYSTIQHNFLVNRVKLQDFFCQHSCQLVYFFIIKETAADNNSKKRNNLLERIYFLLTNSMHRFRYSLGQTIYSLLNQDRSLQHRYIYLDEIISQIQIQYATLPQVLAMVNSIFTLLMILGIFGRYYSQNSIKKDVFILFFRSMYQSKYIKIWQS